MKTLIALIVAGALLAGCESVAPENKNGPEATRVFENTSRLVDTEAGVVCWMFVGATYRSGGISCLPISDTRLGE